MRLNKAVFGCGVMTWGDKFFPNFSLVVCVRILVCNLYIVRGGKNTFSRSPCYYITIYCIRHKVAYQV